MPTGGNLCLSHRRCSEELHPALFSFLVPAFRLVTDRSAARIPRCISTLHRKERLKQAQRGHSFLRRVISGGSRTETVPIRNSGCGKVFANRGDPKKKTFVIRFLFAIMQACQLPAGKRKCWTSSAILCSAMDIPRLLRRLPEG